MFREAHPLFFSFRFVVSQMQTIERPFDLKLSECVVFDQGKGRARHGWVVMHMDSHYNPLRCSVDMCDLVIPVL